MSAANSSPPAKPSQAMMIMGAPPSKPAAENKKQTVTPSNSLNLSAVHPSDGQPAFLPALPSPKTFRKDSITESDYKKQNSMNEEM